VAEWRNLLHYFHDPSPTLEHFVTVEIDRARATVGGRRSIMRYIRGEDRAEIRTDEIGRQALHVHQVEELPVE